jgi:hypothetical protein
MGCHYLVAVHVVWRWCRLAICSCEVPLKLRRLLADCCLAGTLPKNPFAARGAYLQILAPGFWLLASRLLLTRVTLGQVTYTDIRSTIPPSTGSSFKSNYP